MARASQSRVTTESKVSHLMTRKLAFVVVAKLAPRLIFT